MKRVGKGIYDVPGGKYYRAISTVSKTSAIIIVNFTECIEYLHRWNDKPALKASPDQMREFGMLLIEAAAHADAAERYGKALDSACDEGEAAARKASDG